MSPAAIKGLTARELVEAASEQGLSVTSRQVDSWRAQGLLPPATRSEAGARRWIYPEGSLTQLVRLIELRGAIQDLELVRVGLWLEGFRIDLDRVRKALRSSLRSLLGATHKNGPAASVVFASFFGGAVGERPPDGRLSAELESVLAEATDADMEMARRSVGVATRWWPSMRVALGEGQPSEIDPGNLPLLFVGFLAALREPVATEADLDPARAAAGAKPAKGEVRRAIVEAGVKVVAESGFDGLTYRAVAKRAGTTHGAVGYHFKTREELIHEVALEARRLVAGTSIVPPEGRRVRFAGDLARSGVDDLDAHLFHYELSLQARRRPDLAKEMRSLYEGYFDITRYALEEIGVEGPDEGLVRVVFAARVGLLIQQIVNDRPEQTDEAVIELQRLLAAIGGHDGG